MLTQTDRLRSGNDLRGGDGVTDEEASAHDRGHDPGIVVIPYGEISPGMMSIGTMVLHEYYLHMKRDGTVETTFTGMGMDSPEAFVKLLTEPPNLLVGVVAEGQLFGLAWLNHIGPNSAWAHFSALSEAWGKCTVEMGRAVLRYWWGLPKANGELVILRRDDVGVPTW